MSVRKVIAAIAALIVIGLVAWLVRPSHASQNPPVLNFLNSEPAGIVDDAGAEMWLAYVSLSNPDNGPAKPGNLLYVKNVEVQAGNRWIAVERPFSRPLAAGQEEECALLVSAHADRCQVRFKYAGASPSLKGPVRWLAERLPKFIRFRLPHAVWRWLGFNLYEPGSDWREVGMELSISTRGGSRVE